MSNNRRREQIWIFKSLHGHHELVGSVSDIVDIGADIELQSSDLPEVGCVNGLHEAEKDVWLVERKWIAGV